MRQVFGCHVFDGQIAIDETISFGAFGLVPEDSRICVTEFYATAGIVPLALAFEEPNEQQVILYKSLSDVTED